MTAAIASGMILYLINDWLSSGCETTEGPESISRCSSSKNPDLTTDSFGQSFCSDAAADVFVLLKNMVNSLVPGTGVDGLGSTLQEAAAKTQGGKS